MNADEAQKCIDIAVRKLDTGDVQGAKKFANKAAALHDSAEVQTLLKKIASTKSATSSATPNGSAATRPAVNREHTQPKREFTPDQEALVKRVRKCSHTAFYEILAIKKESSDGEVKKAYRKLALQLHPDKNGAPGADEAFKMVSRAFQILSDEGKREQFDRYGADPDSRQPTTNGFAGHAQRGGMQQGNMFGEEINADDLFNMFFGQGLGGQGGFGGSPFVSFGGPGVRVHHFGGGRRAAGQAGAAQGAQTNWIQLLPLIVLFGFSVLSSLFSGAENFFSSSPSYSFENASPYTSVRYTPNHKIPYWVNPTQVKSVSVQNLAQLDRKAEVAYVRSLRENCELEYQERERRKNNAYGFFSIDKVALTEAKNMKLPNCEQLQSFGYRL